MRLRRSGTRSKWSMSAGVPTAFPFSHHVAMASTWLRSSSLPCGERRTRSREMAADRVRAARAVGPFGGDHRQRDVRPCVVRIFGDRGSERDRRAVLDGQQATHTLGVRRWRTGQLGDGPDEAGRAYRALARVVLVGGEQLRDSGCLGTDFGNRGALPLLTLADQAETDDVRDRDPGRVDEVAVRVDAHADAARMQRCDVVGQQVRPKRGAVQGPPIPRGARGDDDGVTAPTH